MNYFWQQTDFPDFHFEGADFTSQIQKFANDFWEVHGVFRSKLLVIQRYFKTICSEV
jgi:hypothetical protein